MVTFFSRYIDFYAKHVCLFAGIFFCNYSHESLTGKIFFVIILIEIDFQFFLITCTRIQQFNFYPYSRTKKGRGFPCRRSGRDTALYLDGRSRLVRPKDDVADADMLDDLHRVITAARLNLIGKKLKIRVTSKIKNFTISEHL